VYVALACLRSPSIIRIRVEIGGEPVREYDPRGAFKVLESAIVGGLEG